MVVWTGLRTGRSKLLGWHEAAEKNTSAAKSRNQQASIVQPLAPPLQAGGGEVRLRGEDCLLLQDEQPYCAR